MSRVYALVGDSRPWGRGQDGQDEERRGIVAVATMERAPAGDQAQSHVRGRFLAFFGADDQDLTPGVTEDRREAGNVDPRAPPHAAQGAPERHHKSPGPRAKPPPPGPSRFSSSQPPPESRFR